MIRRNIQRVRNRLRAREWRARGKRDEIDTDRLLTEVLTETSRCIDIGANHHRRLWRRIHLEEVNREAGGRVRQA